MEKKRTRRATDGGGGDGSDGGGVSAAVAELPHDLVVEEVLTRLPGKSLMRFKYVSKLWCSIIDDPRFCQAHRAHSRSRPTLLILCPTPNINDELVFFYSTQTLGVSTSKLELLRQFTMCSGLGGVTDVVNGLFCLYRGNRVWICSISADQGIRLPPSSLIQYPNYNYYFGYDCVSKKYKLLKVCALSDRDGEYIEGSECEILTLGKDESWRTIHGPSIDIWKQWVYIHGDGDESNSSTLCFWHRLF
ncbi:putative F-box protein At1g47790 isoform X1 [Actinidia eriantha]|uniref:putative F-box protein At1g47790 isoform X1 n=1 Tax=Actinidia eriantha TaxID=165200 RepID=UPI00258791B7|nr:putative F-box protein At1g47790 isoform X1 [Actinidia eriantha]